MKKLVLGTCMVIMSGFVFSGCTLNKPTSEANIPKVADTQTTLPTVTVKSENTAESVGDKEKVCGWIDKSDIVIELSFADGVVKDTSYEAGFYFSPIYSTMRLARSNCDYRTGFNYSEFLKKGVVEVGVRGYSDNNRRQIEGQPISVVFDENGKPNVDLPIRVKVMN